MCHWLKDYNIKKKFNAVKISQSQSRNVKTVILKFSAVIDLFVYHLLLLSLITYIFLCTIV